MAANIKYNPAGEDGIVDQVRGRAFRSDRRMHLWRYSHLPIAHHLMGASPHVLGWLCESVHCCSWIRALLPAAEAEGPESEGLAAHQRKPSRDTRCARGDLHCQACAALPALPGD